ncbi:Elongator complex protein 5 [Armadillidium vulgare]|nr:Elongator complex protein 5 [Armadillidium vulgare]
MSKYLLKKILNLSELPQGIVFSDEYPVCCRNLVWCLLKSHLDAGREVHYFCFSIKPEKIQKYFSSGIKGVLKMYDFYTDPMNWLSTENPNIEKTFNDIYSLCRSEDKIVVVIDSVNSAVDLLSTTILFRHLQKLKTVIVYCYNDNAQNNIKSSISHLMPISINVHSDEPLNCSIVWKKQNGKVLISKEEFSVSENFELQFCREVKSNKEPSQPCNSDTSVLEMETTFNLSLSDAQKEARKKVVLPHTRIQSNGGHISYIPDESDDWDDEDPDADLDL